MVYNPIKRKSLEPASFKFSANSGLDLLNPQQDVQTNALTVASNIVATDTGFRSINSITVLGGIAGANITGFGSLGNYLLRSSGTKVQFLQLPGGSSWTDTSLTTWLTAGINTEMANFFYFNNASSIGTATGGALRYVTMTSGMTINAHIGKILQIASGTGAGQKKMVASNTTDTIYIDGVFDIIPDNTSTINICDRISATFIANGTDNLRVIWWTGAGASWQGAPFVFNHICTVGTRLYATKPNDENLYFSDDGIAYFGISNFIAINPNGDPITGLTEFNGQLVIYKNHSRYRLQGDSPDTFTLIPSQSAKGNIAPLGIAPANNLQFFVSTEGIELLNAVENTSAIEGIPLSRILNIAWDSGAVAGIYKNMLYVYNNAAWYVYDVYHSQLPAGSVLRPYSRQIWTNAILGTPLTMKNIQGVLYIGIGQSTYVMSDTPDNSSSGKITTGRFTMGDPERRKMIRRLELLWKTPASSITITVKAFYDGAFSVGTQQTFDIHATPRCIMMLNSQAKDVQFEISWVGAVEFIEGTVLYDALAKTPSS